MKKHAKQRMKKRPARFVVGYMGNGNALFGRKSRVGNKLVTLGCNRLDGEKETVDIANPLNRRQAEALLKQMPCADCAIFELVPVEVNR